MDFRLLMACTTVLPPTNAEDCDYELNFGEINALLFTEEGDGLTNWSSATEWNTRIDNTTAYTNQNPAPIRVLFGIGGLGAPERGSIKISRRRTAYLSPKFSFVFQVEDTGDTNWAFMRALPDGGQTYSGWLATESKLFGGNSGIKMTIVADPNIPESIDELMKINVTVSFEGSIPNMIDLPAITALS